MTTQMNEEIASKILMRQGHLPVNVTALAEDIGLKVWEADLGANISGKLFKDDSHGGRRGFSIIVNSREPFERRRYTVAHELAHYILHRELVRRMEKVEDNTFYRANGFEGWQELEANHLAAQILMPIEILKKFKKSGKTPEEMAAIFRVSEPAMRIRLGIQPAPWQR